MYLLLFAEKCDYVSEIKIKNYGKEKQGFMCNM